MDLYIITRDCPGPKRFLAGPDPGDMDRLIWTEHMQQAKRFGASAEAWTFARRFWGFTYANQYLAVTQFHSDYINRLRRSS